MMEIVVTLDLADCRVETGVLSPPRTPWTPRI
jgi:hypothetical protein